MSLEAPVFLVDWEIKTRRNADVEVLVARGHQIPPLCDRVRFP
jgi:hypothetical protein